MLPLEASVGQALRALDGTGGPLGPPLGHTSDASCDACQNSYSKPTQNLFPGWHWWLPWWSLDGSPWVILVMPLVMHVRNHVANPLTPYSLDGTGGPPGLTGS